MEQYSEKDLSTIQQSELFQNINLQDIQHLLTCLHAHVMSYQKNEVILANHQQVFEVGLILEGSVNVERMDYYGNRHLVTSLFETDIFAESIAATRKNTLNLSVVATKPCRIVFFAFDQLKEICKHACIYHQQLLENLLVFLSSRNIFLQEKLTYLTQPSLEDKLLSYLSNVAMQKHSLYFEIPFNRQELADFLNADRSSVSACLSSLKQKGILDTYKNQFRFLKDPSHFIEKSL